VVTAPPFKNIAIIGTGPAALMAASIIAADGRKVSVFEKNKGPGRKLLIAGGSGLNISNSLPLPEFVAQYTVDGIDWLHLLQQFSPSDWLAFIHHLKLETFEGTSGRYFVREMKASGLLRAWLADLESKGVAFHYGHELKEFTKADGERIVLQFADGQSVTVDAAVLALGGASWLAENETLGWPQTFAAKGIAVTPFTAANCGFEVDWKNEFLAEALNLPLKNAVFTSSAGSKKGDILITAYGLEGTPVYTYGRGETCYIDLKSDLNVAEIEQKLDAVRENLSPLRRAKKTLGLPPAALALLYHHAPEGGLQTNAQLAQLLKKFPVTLLRPRPLSEAISSAGGIALGEVTTDFELKKFPGVFTVGEMLDWSAPTGGFLIQACVSQGHAAGSAICRRFAADP
jgi:uncharacterized flavoprotein (TIGR03862 family)